MAHAVRGLKSGGNGVMVKCELIELRRTGSSLTGSRLLSVLVYNRLKESNADSVRMACE